VCEPVSAYAYEVFIIASMPNALLQLLYEGNGNLRREGEREREVRAAKGEHSMYGYEMNAATVVRRNTATFVLRCEPTKR